MSAPSNVPRLVVINQVVSDNFFRWLRSYSRAEGPVELWTGTSCDPAGAPIRICAMPHYDRTSKGARLRRWLTFTIGAVWRLIFTPRGVPVLTTTNPPLMPLVLVVFRVLLGRRYGIIEYDIYPQVMATMRLIRPRGVIYSIWWHWHCWALARAEVVIAISDIMADELRAMAQGHTVNLTVIPTWTDTKRIQPTPHDQNPFAASLKLREEVCVIYSGNLGETHSIETIVEVAGALKHRSDIRFLIIGNGSKRWLVEDAIASGCIPTTTLLPTQDAETFPYALASADIAFVTLAAGFEQLSLPSKTYDMMAAGCAIIGISPDSSGLAQIVDEHTCGRNFAPDQVDAIVSWIIYVVAEREILKGFRNAARAAAERHFSAAACEPAMTRVVQAHLIETRILA